MAACASRNEPCSLAVRVTARCAACFSAANCFSKSLAQEIASRNVTVNCVAPGFIESDMTGKLNDKQKDAIMGAIPMKRMGKGEEIASAVAWLASDGAGYVTGQTIHVNGGMAMI